MSYLLWWPIAVGATFKTVSTFNLGSLLTLSPSPSKHCLCVKNIVYASKKERMREEERGGERRREDERG